MPDTVTPDTAVTRTATPTGWQLASGNLRESVRSQFPARPLAAAWPATGWSRLEVWAHATCLSFTPVLKASQDMRGRGLTRMLDWLDGQPGETWQERWLAGRAEDAGVDWRRVPVGWLAERGWRSRWLPIELAWALKMLISADVARPSLGWLLSVPAIKGTLAREFVLARDVEGFSRLQAHCDARHLSAPATRRTLQRSAVIVAAKGGVLADITVGDVLELLDAEVSVLKTPPHDVPVFYQMLHELGIFGPEAPARIRELRTGGQQTAEELIDRYRLQCRPVRDLLVEYLRERQPGLDYNSVRALAYYLGKRFWKDLELHHPGIDSLHLDPEVVSGWRQRLLTQQKTVTTKTGDKAVVSSPRFSHGQCLTSVRAFYLDLAQWAIEDPARWARWAAPCPIRQDETGNRKTVRRRKARMDARTRERLPVLPVLVRTVDQRRKTAEALLHAARQTQPGDSFRTFSELLNLSRSLGCGSGWVHGAGLLRPVMSR